VSRLSAESEHKMLAMDYGTTLGAIGGIKFLNQDNLFTIKWLSLYKKGGIVF
jgi:hypothetical protein